MLIRRADLRSSPSKRQVGFSLLELLIVALILTVVLFAIYSMYVTNMTTATWGNKKAEHQQNLRVALDMMQREIRMAGYDPLNTGVTPAIQDATLSATGLTFIADIDNDGTTDKVQYTFNSGPQTITRSVVTWNGSFPTFGAPEVVADGVSSLSLTYKDGADSVTTQAASVRKITIAITAISGETGSQAPAFNLTSDVRLRNLP